jgi:4-hydroxyphenylacetate 3-monooxygenase
VPTESYGQLRRGSEYIAALANDDRRVWVSGERIPDVTKAPTLGAGISMMAGMLDDQFDPALTDTLTYVDDGSGQRVSRAWQAPTTLGELQDRRRLMEYTTMQSVGTFGRPLDLGPTIAVGLLARKPAFKKSKPDFARNNPDFADNIDAFVEFGRSRGIIAAEVLAEPQNDRSRYVGEGPGLLRVVAQEAAGVRVSGAKSVGSVAAQADEIIFTNLKMRDYPPEACIWAALPVATEGLTLVCREGTSKPDADPFDHPIAHRGEESDQLIIFDNVLIPNDRVFNVGDPDLLDLYGPVTVWAHWQILTRMAVKAEIIVGAAQTAVNMIGTGGIAGVRTMVGDLMEYAQALKAFVVAAEHLAAPTEGGVLAPDSNMLTAGRLYSVAQYPRIIHTLQEICGQGLVMRFSRADFDHPEIGAHLERLLPGHNVTARQKNHLMNFIWDLTTDSHAGRVELFENVNGSPAPALRERLYREYPREHVIGMVRELLGAE